MELIRELYHEFREPLYTHALRLTGNDRQWAEDVVQETMFRAWRNAEKLDREPGPLGPWLFTVARRVVIDARRVRSARPHEVDATVLEAMPVADQSERALTAMVVSAAINTLSDEHRAAIELTYLRGCTVSEASKALGIPPGTVKSRVYYALRALRWTLHEQC